MNVNGGLSTNHAISKKIMFIHNGGEVCKSLCRRGVWWIEQCPPNQILNALLCKRTLITTARWKSYQQKQLMVFLLHVMMVGCPSLKVVLMNFTNYCDDLNHCVGGSQTKYVLIGPYDYSKVCSRRREKIHSKWGNNIGRINMRDCVCRNTLPCN